MKLSIEIDNINELDEFAKVITPLLFRGAIICLGGNLGAGKTTFTKSVAKYLGVKGTVNSPTFNILKIYNNELPLYHMDVYRLENIGFDYELDDYLYGDGVAIIEWYKYIEKMLPKEILEINFAITGENKRLLTIEGSGKYEEIIKNISNRYSY